MKINITNGDSFNKYISRREEGLFVPFREAMIEGDSSKNIFSNDFNVIRATNHHVFVDDYLNSMNSLYDALRKINTYSEICLWFGNDAFCQINLLTILAYLDKNNYKGNIKLKIINDSNYQILKQYELINDEYYNKYCELLINHNAVTFNDIFMNDAGKVYFDLSRDNGTIATLIKNNSFLSNRELFNIVWDKTREYGLGDSQVSKLIEKYIK